MLWTVGVSGGLLLACSALFSIERTRGRRVLLPHVRAWLDEQLAALFLRFSHLSLGLGSGTIRIAALYLMHRLLGILMRLIKLGERAIARLQARNRRVARTVRAAKDKTHLDLIAEHKQTVSLTEREKRQLKKQWLG
jgi:hypothetical protein